MTISRKIKNKKYISRKIQYGGKDCKFPEIWENEIDGECVSKCPENTYRRYDIHGKFKCAKEKCLFFTPKIRSFGTHLFNKASSILSSKSASYDGISIPNYENPLGKDLIYYGPLKSGKPHGNGIAVLNDIGPELILYGNWENGIIQKPINIYVNSDDPSSQFFGAMLADMNNRT